MIKTFYPDNTSTSAFEIPYEALYARGIRALIFDIDNTLTEHGKPARWAELYRCTKKMGYSCATCPIAAAETVGYNGRNQKRRDPDDPTHHF